MDMIPVFIIFSFFHLFSVLFNIFLWLVIFVHRDKSRIPVVYIYNLVICSTFNATTLFISFSIPILLDDSTYYELRKSYGPYITIICTFSYEHPLYISCLMIIQRIYTVYSPTTRIFRDSKLWVYCGIISVISLVSLLIPFFSDCFISINQRTMSFESSCQPGRHPITLLQNKYLLVLPITSMILNVMLIIYLSSQKRFLGARITQSHSLSVVSINSRNVQLPPILRSKPLQNLERTLLLQSFATTTFLLFYELSGLLIRTFSVEYATLPENTKIWIFYTRITSTSLLNFLVYFIGTPSVRYLIIEKATLIYYETTNISKSSLIAVRSQAG